jgi:hypothetical protein
MKGANSKVEKPSGDEGVVGSTLHGELSRSERRNQRRIPNLDGSGLNSAGTRSSHRRFAEQPGCVVEGDRVSDVIHAIGDCAATHSNVIRLGGSIATQRRHLAFHGIGSREYAEGNASGARLIE